MATRKDITLRRRPLLIFPIVEKSSGYANMAFAVLNVKERQFEYYSNMAREDRVLEIFRDVSHLGRSWSGLTAEVAIYDLA